MRSNRRIPCSGKSEMSSPWRSLILRFAGAFWARRRESWRPAPDQTTWEFVVRSDWSGRLVDQGFGQFSDVLVRLPVVERGGEGAGALEQHGELPSQGLGIARA